MTLDELRMRIDEADATLLDAFCARMEASAAIAAYKREHGLPILDAAREQAKLADISAKAGPEFADYAAALYARLFELSRDYQSRLMNKADSEVV